MSTILMIRHGQASFGEENYDKLSPTGERQAVILAERLAADPRPLDAVVCGTLVRHRTTAEPLKEAFDRAGRTLPGFLFWPEFDEFDAASVWQNEIRRMMAEDEQVVRDLENMVKEPAAFLRLYRKAMARWAEGRVEPGVGPRWEDFQARVKRGHEKLRNAFGGGKRVAVFTSGGPVCVSAKLALGLSDRRTMDLGMEIRNASISLFLYGGRGFSLVGLNDIAHLEARGEPGLLTHR